MALDLVVDKIDTLPEHVRGFYVEKEGKFHLDASKIEIEDTGGLKRALAAERDRAAKHEKAVKAWEKLGKTPDEIAELTSAAERAAEEALKKSGKHDEILAAKLAQAAKDRADSEAKLTGERDSAISLARKAVIDTRIGGALTKGKVTPEGLELLTERLGKRVKLDFVDGKESISIVNLDGTPMIGSAKDGLATFDDLVKEATTQYPSLFEGSGAGGGGKSPTNRQAGSKTISRADWETMDATTRQSRLKEGYKITD